MKIIKNNFKYTCGPCISAHALPLDGELTFYFKNDLFIKKMIWSRHLFLFYFFKSVNKIRKKTLSVIPYSENEVCEKPNRGSRVKLLIGKVR